MQKKGPREIRRVKKKKKKVGKAYPSYFLGCAQPLGQK